MVFLEMADKVASGLVPYRDFVLEYPPLALLPLLFPRLISGPSEDAYDRARSPWSRSPPRWQLAAAVAWLAGRGW